MTDSATPTRVASPDGSERAPGAPARRTPGEEGLWVFLLGDMVIFVVMFVVYLQERSAAPEDFTGGRESIGLAIAVTNTFVLLVSSLMVVLGLTATRGGAHRAAGRFYSLAVVCALVFVALKATEYVHLVTTGHGPGDGPFFMWLFILTGVHLAHVAVGVPVLIVLGRRARRRVEPQGAAAMVYEGGACYWHMVDLLWMMLFPLLYVVA